MKLQPRGGFKPLTIDFINGSIREHALIAEHCCWTNEDGARMHNSFLSALWPTKSMPEIA